MSPRFKKFFLRPSEVTIMFLDSILSDKLSKSPISSVSMKH